MGRIVSYHTLVAKSLFWWAQTLVTLRYTLLQCSRVYKCRFRFIQAKNKQRQKKRKKKTAVKTPLKQQLDADICLELQAPQYGLTLPLHDFNNDLIRYIN